MIRGYEYEIIYDLAESHWPAMVNRDRTRLIVATRSHESERKEVLVADTPGITSVSYEPESVGDYRMAYDPRMDILIVWDEDSLI